MEEIEARRVLAALRRKRDGAGGAGPAAAEAMAAAAAPAAATASGRVAAAEGGEDYGHGREGRPGEASYSG
jgi:hypothetical protein